MRCENYDKVVVYNTQAGCPEIYSTEIDFWYS